MLGVKYKTCSEMPYHILLFLLVFFLFQRILYFHLSLLTAFFYVDIFVFLLSPSFNSCKIFCTSILNSSLQKKMYFREVSDFMKIRLYLKSVISYGVIGNCSRKIEKYNYFPKEGWNISYRGPQSTHPLCESRRLTTFFCS